MDWTPEAVTYATTSADGQTATWTYTGPDIPNPGDAAVHLNLWLYQGAPRPGAGATTFTITDFTFVPIS